MTKAEIVKVSIDYLNEQLIYIQSDPLRNICRVVINDPRFQAGYGAESKHHDYQGGLATHTAEVTKYAAAMAFPFKHVNYTVLLVSAIIHDYYKIFDYDPRTGESTPYRRKIRHLSGSHAWFVTQVDKFKICDPDTEEIEHCLLAHHGRKEWGSPIEPQTLEAFILHSADMLSFQFGEYKENPDAAY